MKQSLKTIDSIGDPSDIIDVESIIQVEFEQGTIRWYYEDLEYQGAVTFSINLDDEHYIEIKYELDDSPFYGPRTTKYILKSDGQELELHYGMAYCAICNRKTKFSQTGIVTAYLRLHDIEEKFDKAFEAIETYVDNYTFSLEELEHIEI